MIPHRAPDENRSRRAGTFLLPTGPAALIGRSECRPDGGFLHCQPVLMCLMLLLEGVPPWVGRDDLERSARRKALVAIRSGAADPQAGR